MSLSLLSLIHAVSQCLECVSSSNNKDECLLHFSMIFFVMKHCLLHKFHYHYHDYLLRLLSWKLYCLKLFHHDNPRHHCRYCWFNLLSFLACSNCYGQHRLRHLLVNWFHFPLFTKFYHCHDQ